jgi:uncharacterized membrane protein
MLKSLRQLFRQCFLTGLITLIPMIATIWVLQTIVIWSEDFFFGLIPAALRPQVLVGMNIPGIGLVFTIALIMIVGVITRTYLAKQLLHWGELLLGRVPIARGVYPGIKRLMQVVVGDSTAKATRVVLAPYPHPNSRAYAFVTGEIVLPNVDGVQENHLRVFVPTTPNPTSGFLIMVPESITLSTDLTIEQASKLIVSGGLV